MNRKSLSSLLTVLLVTGCSPATGPVEGPDKQFSGGLQGAITGAGAGAVTGFQMTAGTGPAALVGAGFGAIAGGIQGASEDNAEEEMMRLSAGTTYQRERAHVQHILNEHYKRRLELHPTRDIFPADLFFEGDSLVLSRQGRALVREIGFLNEKRLPWSRLVVAVYIKSAEGENSYGEILAKKRAIQIGDALIKSGIEPRRIETRPTLMPAPVLIDPHDKPGRYNQAVEFLAADR